MKHTEIIYAFFNRSNDIVINENEYTPPKGLGTLKTSKTVQPIKRNTNKKSK